MGNNLYTGLFVLSVLISCLSQVLLKKSSLMGNQGISFYINRYSVCAYAIFLMATVLTLIAYRGVALSEGQLIETSGFIFTAMFGSFFFKETISFRYLTGMVLIIAGFIVYYF